MNIKDYIDHVLQSLDTYKAQNKMIKQKVQDGDTKTIILVVSSAEQIMAQKPSTNTQYQPLVQLNSLRMVKEGIDTGNKDILRQFMNSRIPQYIEFNYANFDPSSTIDDRGAFLYSQDPDATLKMVGNSMFRLSLEICYYLGNQYEQFESRKSSIRQVYENLLAKNIKFPEKVYYFKNSPLPNPSQGSQQHIQQAKQNHLQNQVSYNSSSQNSSNNKEDEVINEINDDLDSAEKHYNKILDCFEVDQESQLDRVVLSQSLLGVNNFQKVVSLKDENLLQSNVIRDIQQKNNLQLDIEDMKEDIEKVLNHINRYTQKKITFLQLKNLLFSDGAGQPDDDNNQNNNQQLNNQSTHRSQNVPDSSRQQQRNSARRNSQRPNNNNTINYTQNTQNSNNIQSNKTTSNQNKYQQQQEEDDLEVEDVEDITYENTKVTAFRAQNFKSNQYHHEEDDEVEELEEIQPQKENTRVQKYSQKPDTPKQTKTQSYSSQKNPLKETNTNKQNYNQSITSTNYNNSKEIQDLKDQQRKLEQEKQKLQENQKQQLTGQQSEFQQQISQLKDEMISKENDLQKKIYDINQEKLEISHQNNLLQGKIENLQDKISQKDKEINQLNLQLSKHENEKQVIQQSMVLANNKQQELDSQTKDYQLQLSQKQVDIERIKSENAILTNQLETLKISKNSNTDKINIELQKYISQYSELQKKVNEKDEKLQNNQISIHRLTQENEQLELELRNFKNKSEHIDINNQIIQQYKEQSTKDSQKILELENQITKFKQEVKQLTQKQQKQNNQELDDNNSLSQKGQQFIKKSILKNKSKEVHLNQENLQSIHDVEEDNYNEEKLNKFEENEEEKYQNLHKKAKQFEKDNKKLNQLLQNLQNKLMDQEELTINTQRQLIENQTEYKQVQEQKQSLENQLGQKQQKLQKQKKQIEELQVTHMLNMQKTQDLLFEKLSSNTTIQLHGNNNQDSSIQKHQSQITNRNMIRSQINNNILNTNLNSLKKIQHTMSTNTQNKEININNNDTIETEEVSDSEMNEFDQQNLGAKSPQKPQMVNIQLQQQQQLQENNFQKKRRNSYRTRKSYSLQHNDSNNMNQMHNTISYENKFQTRLNPQQQPYRQQQNNNNNNSSNVMQFSQPIQLKQQSQQQQRSFMSKQNSNQGFQQSYNIANMSKTFAINNNNNVQQQQQFSNTLNFNEEQQQQQRYNIHSNIQKNNYFNPNPTANKKSNSLDVRQNKSAFVSNTYRGYNQQNNNQNSNISELIQTQINQKQSKLMNNSSNINKIRIGSSTSDYKQQIKQQDKNLVQFNQKYFEQYLIYDIDNFISLKRACLQTQGTIFKNKYISIHSESSITDFQNSKFLKLALSFQNISHSYINNCTVEYKSNKDIQLFAKPQNLQQGIPSQQGIQQEVIIDINYIPNDPLTLHISLQFQDGKIKQYDISLPVTLNKLMATRLLSQPYFQQKWQENQSFALKSTEFSLENRVIQSYQSLLKFMPNLVEINPFSKQEYLSGNCSFQLGGIFSLVLQKSKSDYLIQFTLTPNNTISIEVAPTNRLIMDEDKNILSFLLQTFYFLLQ